MTRRLGVVDAHASRGGLRAAFGCVLALSLALPGWGQEPLRFRRNFVPAEEEAQWRRRVGPDYQAVEVDEFERLVAAAGAAGVDEQDSPPPAKVTDALYRAHWVEPDTLRGSVTWTVTHRGAEPRSALLAPGGSAWIGDVRWQDSGQPVPCGRNEAGEWMLIVDRSGVVEASFSVRGRTHGDRALFDLRWPACVRSVCEFVLPESKELVLLGDSSCPIEESSPDGPPEAAGQTRWRITLGGGTSLACAVAPRSSLERRDADVTVRQVSTYELTRRGLEASVTLWLDVRGEPLDRLTVGLDAGLRLAAARYGLLDVPFALTGDAASPQATLLLPEPLQGTGRMIQLRAVGPFPKGARFTLPNVVPLVSGWQEGQTTLLVSPQLQVSRIETSGCRPGTLAARPVDRSGATYDFLCFEPDAQIFLSVAQREAEIRAVTAVDLQLTATELQATTFSQFQVANGERFELAAAVGRKWIIDDVEASAEAGVVDWEVESREGERQVLRVQLREALSPRQPLRLKITARSLESPLSSTLNLEQLTPLAFQVDDEDRYFRMTPIVPYELRLVRDEQLRRLDPAIVNGLWPEPLAGSPSGLVFQVDNAAQRLGVSLVRERARFAAQIDADATLAGGQLTEEYMVSCQTESPTPSRIVIHLSEARESSCEWRTADGRPLAAVRRAAPEDLKHLKGEWWEVTPRVDDMRDDHLVMHARRVTGLLGEAGLGLPAVQGAAPQAGRVRFRAERGLALAVFPPGLEPAVNAAEDPADEVWQIVRGNYEPSEISRGNPLPRWILPANGQSAPRLMAWEAQVESRIDPESTARQRVLLRLEAPGQATFSCGIPAGAEQLLVTIDNLPATFKVRDDELRIELPSARRYPTVILEFAMPAEAALRSEWLAALWSGLAEPPLAGDWTVWLPNAWTIPPGSARLTRSIETRFHPLRWQSWKDWSGWGRAPQRKTAESLLASIGSLAAATPNGRPSRQTWEQMTQQLAATADALQLSCWIDPQALDRAGLSARSQLLPIDGPHAAERGRRLLDRSRLALVLAPRGVLLTSAVEAALLTDAWWLESGRVAVIEQGSLAARIASRQAGIDLLPPAAWGLQPHSPWRRAPSSSIAGDVVSWNVSRLSLTVDLPAAIPLRHHSWTSAGAVVIFLILLGWGRLWGRPTPRTCWLAVTIAGLFAIFVPVAWAPWMAAAFLALSLTWVMGGLRWNPLVRPSPQIRTPSATDSTLGYAAPLLLLLGLAWEAGHVRAAAPPVVADIFFPVASSEELPVKYCLVPAEFLRQLRAIARTAPFRLLMESATYQAEFAWAESPKRLLLRELRCGFDLRVSSPDAEVVLPLGRAVDPKACRALLDGEPVPWQQSLTGDFVVKVPQPGPARLDVIVVPAVERQGEQAQVDVSIPAIPQSRLELILPPDAPAMIVPTALGSSLSLSTDGRRELLLGGTERLALSWSEKPSHTSSGERAEYSELQWLQFRAGSVTLQCRYALRGDHTALQLEFDPALRPSQARLVEGEALEIQQNPQFPGQLTVPLGAAAAKRATVEIDFLLVNASGLGKTRLPHVQRRGERPVRRWLALSVDPAALAYDLSGAELVSVAIPEFIAQWGPAAESPLRTYRLPDGPMDWSVTTRPRPATLRVADEAHWSVGRERVDLYYEARLEATGNAPLQYRLQLPGKQRIQSLQLRDDVDGAAPARWVVDDEGAVSVYLREPASGVQRLQLQSTFPLSEKEVFRPAPIIWPAAQVTNSRWLVYRQAEVLMEVREGADLERLPPPHDRPAASSGRLVGAWLGHADALLSFSAAPNPLRLQADQRTLLRHDGEEWEAECQLDLRVLQGALDEIRWRIPPQLVDLQVVDPAWPSRMQEIPGENARFLIIEPPQAIRDQARLTLRGRVAIPPGSRLHAPLLAPQGVAELDHQLILPIEAQGQPLAWDTSGLQVVDIPSGWTDRAPADRYQAFRVIGEPAWAEQRVATRPAADARVLSLAIKLQFFPTGQVRQVIEAWILPGGKSSCTFSLVGWKPHSVAVHGEEHQLVDDPSGTVVAAFRSTQLPQHVEILATTDHSAARALTCRPPEIEGLSLPAIDWMIERPAHVMLAPAGERTPLVASRQRVAANLQALSTATELLSRVDPAQVRAWAGPLLNSAQSELRRLRALPNADEDAHAGALAALDEQWALLAARYFPEETQLNHWPAPLAGRAMPLSLIDRASHASNPLLIHESFTAPPATAIVLQRPAPWLVAIPWESLAAAVLWLGIMLGYRAALGWWYRRLVLTGNQHAV